MIALDMETYGSRDLSKVGLRNYVDDPLFTPLVAVVTRADGRSQVFDFISDGFEVTRDRLGDALDHYRIAAHNAGFEYNVLRRIGIELPVDKFIDTAVVAAYHGGGRSLESASAQLLNRPKYALGSQLIKKFCIPGPYQMGFEEPAFVPQIRWDEKGDWQELITYCTIDAELSYQLAEKFLIPNLEQMFSSVALSMNDVGWPIDFMMVKDMQYRYEENLVLVQDEFRARIQQHGPNLSSTQQMQAWCAERGVRSSSFDEEKVTAMQVTLANRLESPALTEEKRLQYEDVRALLDAKQAMGGSSLKKLEVMARQTAEGGRLHDSYLHFGAQATGRTTGRGVQMQNLPRLYGEGDDVTELDDRAVHWDNRKLARNLRQVFRASHPDGRLIVGDFSSVESRGLAYQAEEEWKLQAYAAGEDLYKALASRIYDVPYDNVTKDQRQVGKTGELSCGYGAGGGAVWAFAKNMGVSLSEIEAAALVRDWRAADPATVAWWQALHEALLEAMIKGRSMILRSWGGVSIDRIEAPRSLWALGPKHSLRVVFTSRGLTFTRVIHGVQLKGRNLTYYKPSERKTGDLWSDTFTDPKTGKPRQFTVYGGKLAGLLTQSLCREMFFRSLLSLSESIKWEPGFHNLKIIGQFHDEIVLEWEPAADGVSHDAAVQLLHDAMSTTQLKGFPLDAEIKSAHRYVK